MLENKVILYFLVYLSIGELVNSKTAQIWKLNPEEAKIIFSTNVKAAADEDQIFRIITSTVTNHENLWSCSSKDCQANAASDENTTTATTKQDSDADDKSDVLDCGKAVNFTYYDDLIGVAQRNVHPSSPEPEVAYLFLKAKKGAKSLKNFDIDALERRLKKAKREKPRSVQLYNQIGNFYRIKGDARLSIECFRKALAVSPTNAEVLLNLARVLFLLGYLDDAINLTRRSLEVQPPDRSAWRQYFTLGEIFKAYGHFQESIFHLRHALELHPEHEQQEQKIKQALRDVENIPPTSSLHMYTIIIIVLLVMGVLFVILSSTDTNSCPEEPKVQRHFNRAMAMRSLKGFTQRSIKCRK